MPINEVHTKHANTVTIVCRILHARKIIAIDFSTRKDGMAYLQANCCSITLLYLEQFDGDMERIRSKFLFPFLYISIGTEAWI